jgi:hypothetical protein
MSINATGGEMAGDEKFVVSQVAKILQMPEPLVKDWTNGRRLRIGPQRSAVGRGFPNLYGAVELYKLAIARQLSIDGFTPRAIQRIVDNLGVEFASADFAVVTSDDRHYVPRSKRSNMHVQVVHESQSGEHWWSAVNDQIRTALGCHVLYIAGITQDVNQRVDKFMRKAFGKRRSPILAQHQLSPQAEAEVTATSEPKRKFRKPEKKEETTNAGRSED